MLPKCIKEKVNSVMPTKGDSFIMGGIRMREIIARMNSQLTGMRSDECTYIQENRVGRLVDRELR